MDKGDNGTCLKFSSCCHPGIWKYKIKFFIQLELFVLVCCFAIVCVFECVCVYKNNHKVWFQCSDEQHL